MPTYGHFLRNLIRPKAQCPSRTFHDYVRTQATQHARFIVFSRVEIGNYSIIRVSEMGITRWADGTLASRRIGELKTIGTINTEDMAGDH
jgi:hypothetical protein